MTKRTLLSTGFMPPLVADQLESAFEVHYLHKITDKDAFFRDVGPRVEAVATGAHTGVKTDAAMMGKLPRLKVIGNYGVGYDSIDVATAARRGVIVTNTPDILTEEVADTTIGLLLMTVRELGKTEAFLRAGEWPKQGDYPFTRGTLRDRSIGIVGMGRIGQAIGRRLDGFGIPISYHSRRPQAGVKYRHYPDLVAMAKDVDTLIAIVPGGPSTEKMINAAVLAALGSRGIFINMARGTIVDEPALIEALRKRTIFSAGLDVYWNEPNIDPAFLTLDNVTLLPHVGSASQYTRGKMGQLTVDNILAYNAGKPPLTPVPETPFKGW